jgi:hypothetical protein
MGQAREPRKPIAWRQERKVDERWVESALTSDEGIVGGWVSLSSEEYRTVPLYGLGAVPPNQRYVPGI